MLAKEMATLDHIAEGRVEFGLGAGWMRTDYDESGMPYDRPGVRIDRMIESLQIIKRCWQEDRSTSPATTTRSPTTTASLPYTPGGRP